MQQTNMRVLICAGTGCIASGSNKVTEKFQSEIDAKKLQDKIKIVKTGCHGFCEMGPLVIVYPQGTAYVTVKAEDVQQIVNEHLINGQIVERLLYKEPLTQERVANYEDINFYSKQHRLILKNCGHIDPEDINDYLAVDGYKSLSKVLKQMMPQQVLEEIKASGLRGRGGAGFPTGLKWQFANQTTSSKKYVVCNADEGDPGAFMDRSILEGDPHRIIEGMAICAYAIGADEGYVYVRAEYPLAIKRLRKAIKQAEQQGFLGDKIFASNFNFKLKIKEGAGAFVCGEETALLQSIEGNRGMPRPRPPFPAVSGLWGKPTNINNVETFANIFNIIAMGAQKYAKIGTENSKGTKVFALTGKINNTGLVEVPMGITMREIIYDIGGGIVGGKKIKAVQIGGPSGGCLPEEMLDLTIDYDSLISAGAMIGSGGLVVMDENTCMVDMAKFFLSFTQAESCGKCTPCREGTKRMLEILTRITNGQGKEEDIPMLKELAHGIKQTALCGLGQTAPNPVLSTLKYFGPEYEAHIKHKYCPAKACSSLASFKINENCRGCGLCKKNCPVEAITGELKEMHFIDQEGCIKCGACEGYCQFKAIENI